MAVKGAVAYGQKACPIATSGRDRVVAAPVSFWFRRSHSVADSDDARACRANRFSRVDSSRDLGLPEGPWSVVGSVAVASEAIEPGECQFVGLNGHGLGVLSESLMKAWTVVDPVPRRE